MWQDFIARVRAFRLSSSTIIGLGVLAFVAHAAWRGVLPAGQIEPLVTLAAVLIGLPQEKHAVDVRALADTLAAVQPGAAPDALARAVASDAQALAANLNNEPLKD